MDSEILDEKSFFGAPSPLTFEAATVFGDPNAKYYEVDKDTKNLEHFILVGESIRKRLLQIECKDEGSLVKIVSVRAPDLRFIKDLSLLANEASDKYRKHFEQEKDVVRLAPKNYSKEELADLKEYYKSTHARMMNEYDQRDRDFAMHITINAALFAAIGFVIQWIKPEPGSWLLGGIGLIFLSIIGCIVSVLLFQSVKSFTFWQLIMNLTLARLEHVILPKFDLGLWVQIVARGNVPVGKLPDLVGSRTKLAGTLGIVWFAILLLAIMLSGCGIWAFNNSARTESLKQYWSATERAK